MNLSIDSNTIDTHTIKPIHSMSRICVQDIPLALYIHIPWCVRKCPYCDFNSHELAKLTDFAQYVDALLADAASQVPFLQGRVIASVFIGGGTPSLLPIAQYERLFDGLKRLFRFASNVEVTMEANPATIEHAPFAQYLDVGINRLSIGVQTFNSQQLTELGRIHSGEQALQAIKAAKQAGFSRLNVDLMHGLPKQSLKDAMLDIDMALDAGATHLSWYQLTIEPNTVFYRTQPQLPDEQILAAIEEQGRGKLEAAGFINYEVSAWRSTGDKPCHHNLHYWQFADYLAIGAGAHGKVTLDQHQLSTQFPEQLPAQLPEPQLPAKIDAVTAMDLPSGIYRFSKSRLPKDYLTFTNHPKMVGWQAIPENELIGEFMLDALRLTDGVAMDMFSKRTGLPTSRIAKKLEQLIKKGLLCDDNQRIKTTPLGKRFLNQVIQEFI